MNITDLNFYKLIDEIKSKTLEEIYTNIKNKFDLINPSIQSSLEDYFNKFPYWGKIDIKNNDFEELYNRALSLKNHVDDYVWLYEKLCDYRSKKVLYAILNNWYNFDFNSLNSSIEKNYPHYFDLDVIECNKNEVIVDLGAYIGDTILDYINTYGPNNYKKIYCYEITDESFNILKNNLKYYNNIDFRKKAVSNKKEKLYITRSSIDNSANMVSDEGMESIEAVTIDEDIKDNITLIKMDIEGYEQKALEGCKKHIEKNKPKLLISVYHNHEDLYKIPKIIDEINDYKFYLRYYGNNIFPTEIVLIAK